MSGIVAEWHPEVRGICLGCGLSVFGAVSLHAVVNCGMSSHFVVQIRDLYGISVRTAGIQDPVASRKHRQISIFFKSLKKSPNDWK